MNMVAGSTQRNIFIEYFIQKVGCLIGYSLIKINRKNDIHIYGKGFESFSMMYLESVGRGAEERPS